MLSRVAESIYWMSRQVERAENLARFLEVTHNLALDRPEHLVDPWESLIQVTADKKLFEEKYSSYDAESLTQFLAFDESNPNSMLSSLRQARQNARGVREVLSSEAFEQLNVFYHFVNDASKQPVLESPSNYLDEVRRIAIQWTGVFECTMSHDIGWHFANVGRLIERADKTSRILDVKYFTLLPRVEDVGTAVDDLQWSALLLAISGFEAYRRRHHSIDIEKVVEFFLINNTFPRAVLFCVAGVDWSLGEIEDVSKTTVEKTAKQLVSHLRHRLVETSVKDVLADGMHQFIDLLQTELNQVGDAMNQDYFQSP